MVNTPIPHNLKSECKKAAKILREFTFPSAKSGPDKLIPAGILAKAKGLAILTVVKAGFLVTARGGSGIVIAKLDDDITSCNWSAPSAIGIAGLGGGFEIGAEVTDFVIILNSRSAVEAFSKGGNLTLGGNFSIAAGPLGRNLEADIAVRSAAAIYTYSRTKGLFAGISVEGSALIERKDANRKFYEQDIRAYNILSGEVEAPPECDALYEVLRRHREMAAEAALQMAKSQAMKHGASAGEAISEKFRNLTSRSGDRKTVRKTSTSSVTSTSRDPRGQMFVEKTTRTTTVRTSSKSGSLRSSSSSSSSSSAAAAAAAVAVAGAQSVCKAVVIAPFTAQLPCDLDLDIGDEVEVVTRTESDFDWWEGVSNDKMGIFPANHVKVLGG